jgi:hypothetical protein
MNTKSKAIIAYLIVLTAGFAAGYVFHSFQSSAYSEYSVSEQGRWEHERGPMGREMRIGQRANERLSRQLSLQEEQKAPFFTRISQFYRGVREEMGNRRENEREMIRSRYMDFRENVSDILTEEQLIKLDEVANPDSIESRRHLRGPRR